MPSINHFCITGNNYILLNKLNLNIILSGSIFKDLQKFPSNWHKDCTGTNISKKNKNFGTLTSHYWLWKNKLNFFQDDDWIGINHYRRFWLEKNKKETTSQNLHQNILRFVPNNVDFDILLPEKIYLQNLKLSKLIKKGFKNYIKDPKIFFKRKQISINLHFDLFHGYDLLNQAAELLDKEEVDEFKNYINNECSFYPLQIFISKKKFLEKLYEKTFRWIFKCEVFFSKIELVGYGKERLYDFLAERYFSYYFQKNLKIKSWPYITLKEKLNEV